MSQKYSIEVDDEVVEIYGELTIEEAFDFLSFFERKGYKSLVLGYENSTLRMLKRKTDQEEVIEKQYVIDLKDEIEDFKRSFKIEQERHEETKSKLKHTENLIKALMENSKNMGCDKPETEFKTNWKFSAIPGGKPSDYQYFYINPDPTKD